MLSPTKAWRPDSWRKMSHPRWSADGAGGLPHTGLHDTELARLSAYPRLVSIDEIRRLRAELAQAAQGRGFVLHACDRTGPLEGLHSDALSAHYHLLHGMASELGHAMRLPVVRLGCIVDQALRTSHAGSMDEKRLESAHFHAAVSLNFLRALAREAASAAAHFVSHEAWLLPYEQARLHQDDDEGWYCGSAHFLWIGERSRQLDGAHVEFLRGIANPVGVRIAPGIAPDELLRLIERLDPRNEPGRLALLSRFDVSRRDAFHALLAAVHAEGRQVLWLCDLMHDDAGAAKQRGIEEIAAEVEAFYTAHRTQGTHGAGLHVEFALGDAAKSVGGVDRSEGPHAAATDPGSGAPCFNAIQLQALTTRLVAAGHQIGHQIGQGQHRPEPEEELNLAERLAAARPDSDRPCWIGPGFRLSYRMLNRVVRRQAASLQREGVRPTERVLIALDDGPELAIIFYAALAVGALPVVVNPRLDAASLAQLISDADPTLCFGQSTQEGIWPATVRVRLLCPGDHCRWLREEDEDDAWDGFVRQPLSAPALIQYTSGSTGQPKGVVHSARSVLAACAHFAAGQLGLTADDILYSVPKSFFGYGMGNSLFFPLYLGACGVLDGAWPAAERVASMLREFRPTVLFAVPTMYRLLLEQGLTRTDVAIRLAFSAGAPLPVPLARRWRQAFGFDLHDGIGATEMCHVFATTFPGALRAGSVGRMLPGWEARIVDAEGQELAAGECGVLLVKAPCQALGYWRRPEEERSRFQDGWYRTGDLFRRDEQGLLYFHGREDDRFKVYGRWVVPVEIETLLATFAPELGDVYVVQVRDRAGEDRPALVLRARGEAGELAQLVQLAEATLAAHLESYKHPVLILPVPEIPLNKNGKPERRVMAQWAASRLSESEENIC